MIAYAIYTIITLICIRSHICSFILWFSYISIILIFISFYIMFTSCPLCVSYPDLAIHVLPIFLSCLLLLIHIFISYTLIFIYFPIHNSTVRCFYTVFHITYSAMPLICLTFMYMYLFLCFVIFYFSLSFLAFTHFYHLFLTCSIYSFKYIYHIILYSYHIHVS